MVNMQYVNTLPICWSNKRGRGSISWPSSSSLTSVILCEILRGKALRDSSSIVCAHLALSYLYHVPSNALAHGRSWLIVSSGARRVFVSCSPTPGVSRGSQRHMRRPVKTEANPRANRLVGLVLMIPPSFLLSFGSRNL